VSGRKRLSAVPRKQPPARALVDGQRKRFLLLSGHARPRSDH